MAEVPRGRWADWLRVVHRLEDGLLAVLLGGMILLASSQILLRNVFQGGIGWGDPALRTLVLWVGLLGALAAGRDDRHVTIALLPRNLPIRIRAVTRVVTHLFTAAVSAVVAIHATRFVVSDFRAGTPGFSGVPAWVLETILPVAFGVLAVRYALRTVLCLRAVGRGGGV